MKSWIIGVQPTTILPEPRRVLKAIGAGNASEHVAAQMRKAIDHANALIVDGLAEPRIVAAEVGVADIGPQGIVVDAGLTIPCDGMVFAGTESIIAAIATLGPQLEARVAQEFARHEPLNAVALDAAGTILLRDMFVGFRHDCAAQARWAGKCVGPRISPGCEAMPLEAQGALFALSDAHLIGVSLNDSNVMSPAKSLSAVFPVGSALGPQLQGDSMCRACRHRERCQ